jgi:hypothetical protein
MAFMRIGGFALFDTSNCRQKHNARSGCALPPKGETHPPHLVKVNGKRLGQINSPAGMFARAKTDSDQKIGC